METLRFLGFVIGLIPAQISSHAEIKRFDYAPQFARFMAASALDTRRNHILIFGGRDLSTDRSCDDLLQFDIKDNSWKRLEPDGDSPGELLGAAMAYDEESDAVLIFGGWPAGEKQPSSSLSKLSLNFKNPRWSKLTPKGKRPKGRNGFVFVADSAKRRLLLHGGDRGTDPTRGYLPGRDLWEYDLDKNEWRKLDPTGDIPGSRWNHSGTLDLDGRRLFLYGGAGYEGDRGVIDQDVFCLDLDRLTWKKLPAKDIKPPPLEGASLTYDQKTKCLVLTGGLSLAASGSPGLESLMVYNVENQEWLRVDRMEGTRHGHAAVYDPASNRHFILGGETTKERGNFFVRGTPLPSAIVIKLP